MAVRRKSRRQIDGNAPRAERPQFFFLRNGQNQTGWIEFEVWSIGEKVGEDEIRKVVLPNSLASGSPLWRVDPAYLPTTLLGSVCTSITFTTVGGLQPQTVVIQFNFSGGITGPDVLLIPANWLGIRGPNGEWIAPGEYAFP